VDADVLVTVKLKGEETWDQKDICAEAEAEALPFIIRM
jgi:hypothetical protein